MPQITLNNRLRMNRMCALNKHEQHLSSSEGFVTAFSSQSSGWGSLESRKSYASLSSLADMGTLKRVRHSGRVEGETWGYFVDTN